MPSIHPVSAQKLGLYGYGGGERAGLLFLALEDLPAGTVLRFGAGADETVFTLSAALAAGSQTELLPLMGPALPEPRGLRTLVFVDARVPELPQLTQAAADGALVWVLSPEFDGLAQMLAVVRSLGAGALEAIQIVSHGVQGAVQLGAGWLDSTQLSAQAGPLAELGAALGEGGDLLLFGCDVAQGPQGLQFIADLAQATGADVAASTDATGPAALGGDWVLEASTGPVEAATVVDTAALDDMDSLLAPTITATQSGGTLAVDLDGDSQIDPGDTVRVSVVITNTGDSDATGVTFSETLSGLTLVDIPGAADINVSPLALDDAYNAVGNTLLEVGNATTSTTPQASRAGSVLANDTEFLGDSFTISSYQTTSAQGGTVSMVTTGPDRGSFTYLPAVGYTGTDTFTYTLTDDGLDGAPGGGDDLTSTATVTITVAKKVWYVDSAAPAGGDGRSSSPFNTLTTGNLADGGRITDMDGANDYIYLKGSVSSSLQLEDGQHLIGTGSALVVGGTTLAAAGSRSDLLGSGGNTVNLATNNEISGIRLSATAPHTALSGGSIGTLAVENVSLDSAGPLLDLAKGTVTGPGFVSVNSLTNGGNLNGPSIRLFNIDGTVNFGPGTIYFDASTFNWNDAAIVVQGGTANIDFNVSLSTDGGSEPAILVTDKTAGMLQFDGNVLAGSGGGITLQNNTGATINFTGSLTLNTGTKDAFTATGGGTVSATGSNSTITTSTGTGVNISNTTIGAGGVAFKSVAVNGAANGIVLNNTGSGGFFTVTGDGSQTAGLYDRDASGGTIQNTTGAGVSLTNAYNVTLRQMAINSTAVGQDAVNSSGGGSIRLSAVSIQSPGDSGWDATNLGGVNAVDNNSRIAGWSNLNSVGVGVTNTSVNFTSFTVDDSLFTTSATGGDGFQFVANGTTSGAVVVRDSEFTGIDQDGVQIVQNGSGTLSAVIQHNNFHDADATGGDGNNTLYLANSGSGTLNFTVGGPAAGDGNTFNTVGRLTAAAGVVQVNATTVSQTGTALNGTIQNNTITNSAGLRGIMVGIEANGGSQGTHAIAIENNTITGLAGQGINFTINSVAGGSSNNINLTVRNNTVGTSASPVGTTAGDGGSALEFDTNHAASDDGGDLGVKFLLQNNTFVNNNASGLGDTIDIANRGGDADTDSILNLTVLGNTATNLDAAGRVIDILSSGTGSGAGSTLNLNINSDNTQPNDTTFGSTLTGDIQLRQLLGSFNIESLSGDASTFVSGRNNGDTVTVSGTINALTGAVPLPAAPAAFLMLSPEAAVPAGSGEPASVTPNHPADPSGPSDATPGDAGVTPAAGSLDAAELARIVEAALDRWMASGLTDEQQAFLAGVQFSVAELPGLTLGTAVPGTITLDTDGAGYGWFIDDTPADDVEFGLVVSPTHLRAGDQAAPAGRIDLLTTVLHELGHQLGLEDQYAPSQGDNLLYATLGLGERRLPAAGQADGAVAGSIEHEALLGTSVNIGTLPAGKSVTIQWLATVNAQSNGLIVNPSNQGTVSGSNFSEVQSPAAITILDTLSLRGTVWNDNGVGGGAARNSLKDGSEPGVDGVLVSLFVDADNNDVADTPATPLLTTTTASGGVYDFAGLAPGNYLVRVDQDNFDAGGNVSLTGLVRSSPGNPDPDDNVDSDDNGARLPGQAAFSKSITLAYNTEPGADPDLNETLDFGFAENQLPVVTLSSGSASFVEGSDTASTPVVVDAGLTVSDPDDPTLASVTVSVTTGFQAGQDVLAFANDGASMGNITGVYTPGTGVLNLSSAGATATVAEWQAALRAVTYTNSSDAPDTTTRVVRFVANDGLSTGLGTDRNVTVAAANDTPTGTGDSATTNEDVALVLGTGDFGAFSDPDGTALAAVKITSLATNGVLQLYDTVPGTWGDVVVDAEITAVDIGAGRLRFVPDPEESGTPYGTLGFRVGDGTVFSASPEPYTLTLNVNAVNDAPNVDLNGGLAGQNETATFTEQTPQVLAPAAELGDVDSANLASLTATLVSRPDGNGVESLSLNAAAAAAAAGLSVSYTAATGVLSVSGAASVATYQSILRGVQYSNSSDNPNATARTVNIVVSDGSDTSVSRSVTVSMLPVNDAPTAGGLNAAESYTEDTPLNLTDIVVADVDSATVTATLTLSNTVAGTLNTGTSNAVTSTFDSGAGLWSASGALADVNALLAGITFTPALNFNGSFTLNTSVSDGVAPPVTGSKAFTGTAVNDAPFVANGNAAESYTEDTPLNLINLIVDDVDSATVTATLTLSNTSAGTLNTDTAGLVTSTFAAGVWSASGALADVNALLAGVSFTPALNFNSNFTLSTSVSDGVAPPVSGTKVFTGTPVNDAPTAGNLNAAESYTEDTPLNLINIVADDVDSATVTATLTLSSPLAGTLSTATAGAVTSTFAVGVWSASGALADVNALLAGVTFNPALNFNSSFTVSTRVSDGVAPALTGTKAFIGTPVNDAPFVVNGNAAESYTEDTPLNLINMVVDDVDSATVTVTLTLSDTAAGTLNTATSGAVTSTFAAGVWSASGAPADVNALLAGVTFTPALNFNSSFTLSTSVSDGVAPPVIGTKVFTGTPVNDAPTATNLNAAESYTEDTPLNLINIVVDDVDSATVTATLTLSNTAAGTLNTGTSNAVTSTFAAGVWSASGALADVNALLAGVTFTPALNFNGNFNLNTSVSDGVAPAATGSKAFTGTAVNDAPTSGNDSATTDEDTALVLGASDFGAYADVESNPLAGVRITSLASTGNLEFDTTGAGAWSAVTVDADITAAQLAAGRLRFVPDLNENGSPYASLGFRVSDGTDLSAAAYTLTLNVNPVNDPPVVSSPIPDQEATETQPFLFQFDALAFTDPDAGDSRAYSATLSNGDPLPAWLSFDGASRTFSGTPALDDVGLITVKVTATDGSLATGSDEFDLDIAPARRLVYVEGTTLAGVRTLTANLDFFTGTPLSYSWLKDGVPIPGANTTSYTPVPASEDFSLYSIEVGYSHGVAASEAVDPQAATPPAGIMLAKGDPDDNTLPAAPTRAQVFIGYHGLDTITGTNGADWIDGGPDVDSMTGGLGNDTYIVHDALDVIVEAAGGGTDLVMSYVTVTLPAEVENLTLVGSNAFDGSGNSLPNLITGNGAINLISGLAGNDTVLAGADNDWVDGGANDDRLNGEDGADTLLGGTGADSLIGGAGSDSLDGGDHNDTLEGGAAADVLLGGAGNDSLSGGGGNDTLNGGAGKDTVNGGAGKDTIVLSELPAAGQADSIVGFVVADDTFQLVKTGVFTALNLGTLNGAAFWSGTAAHDADDRIIYTPGATSGTLWYDADGNGAGAAVQIATITGLSGTLNQADFVVVA